MQRYNIFSPIAMLNILVVLGFTILSFIWGKISGFSFEYFSFLTIIILSAIFFPAAWYYTYIRKDKNIAGLFVWVVLVFYGTCITMMLSYLSASLNFPLLDDQFHRIDQAMGLDWVAFQKTLSSYESVSKILNYFYMGSAPMVFVLVIIFALVGKIKDLEILVTALLFAAISVALLAGLFPAVGPYYHLLPIDAVTEYKPVIMTDGPSNYIQALHGLREGTLRIFSLATSKGVVTFPSYHAVLSVIIILALRGTGKFFIVALLYHLVVLFSIPVSGGHYFIDVVAGVVIALLSWKAAVFVENYYDQRIRRVEGCAAKKGSLVAAAAK